MLLEKHIKMFPWIPPKWLPDNFLQNPQPFMEYDLSSDKYKAPLPMIARHIDNFYCINTIITMLFYIKYFSFQSSS